MYQWAMNDYCTVLYQKKYHSLNFGDINSDIEEQKHKNVYANIQLNLGDYLSPPKDPIEEQEMFADDTKGEQPTMYNYDSFE